MLEDFLRQLRERIDAAKDAKMREAVMLQGLDYLEQRLEAGEIPPERFLQILDLLEMWDWVAALHEIRNLPER